MPFPIFFPNQIWTEVIGAQSNCFVSTKPGRENTFKPFYTLATELFRRGVCVTKVQTNYAEKHGIRENLLLPAASESVGISKDLSNAHAEAEDEKRIINLFKRKQGTNKEKAAEVANSENADSLTFNQLDIIQVS